MTSHGAPVSILAHLERWALLVNYHVYGGVWSFQSSPHLERWALRCGLLAGRLVIWFQSSPTSKGGRYSFSCWSSSCGSGVSILAHLERWALRRSSQEYESHESCFNPRPPRKVGATVFLVGLHPVVQGFQSSPTSKGGRYVVQVKNTKVMSLVSILAHLERWALLSGGGGQGGGRSGFNPRPPRKVGATHHAADIHQSRDRFNPRPPRKVGATFQCLGYGIHVFEFQSSPTSKGGRYYHDGGGDDHRH